MKKEKSFYEKINYVCNEFYKQEKEIRKLIDIKDFEKAIEICSKIFYDNLEYTFELGFNNKYDLIFSIQNSKEKIFELIYLKNHLHKDIFKYWNIVIGIPPINNFAIKMFNINITQKDITIYLDKKTKNINIYSKKILPLLKENENHAYELINILINNSIGEISFFKYMNNINILSKPKLLGKINLSNLSKKLELLYGKNIYSINDIYDNYCVYENINSNCTNTPNRKDIVTGNSCFLELMQKNNTNYFNKSIELGYLSYPINSNEDINIILDNRNKLEDKLNNQISNDYIKIIGSAIGKSYCYIDIIVWDIDKFLSKLKEFTKKETDISNIIYKKIS